MMVGRRDDQSRPAQSLSQLAAPVDANMTPRHVVVLARQRPAHPFGPPSRHRDHEQSARSDDAAELGHGGGIVADMFENLGGDGHVELRVLEGQASRVGEYGPKAAP